MPSISYLIQFIIPPCICLQSIAQLPSWVSFPLVERAEWLNSMLVELWPHVDALTWKIIQEKVQPMAKEILAEYHLTGFR